MEYTNDQLVAEKKTQNGDGKVFTLEEKKLWIPFGKISWPAIFAGVLVTVVTQLLFSLLGMGIGIGTAAASADDQDPARGLGVAAMIWWSATMLISLFLGGLTTGRMYQTRSKMYLTWHGLLTWCTFTVFSFFMLTNSVGMVISGTGNVISTALTAGASANQNSSLDISSILRNAQGMMMSPNGFNNRNEEANVQYDDNGNRLTQQDVQNNQRRGLNATQSSTGRENVQGSASGTGTDRGNTSTFSGGAGVPYLISEVRMFFSEDNIQNAEARENLVNTLVNQTGMTRAEANSKIDQWSSSYQQLKADAQAKAEEVGRTVSTASFVAFFALIIGALVTIWGARVAPTREYAMAKRPDREYTSEPR
jgi:hypothetical protein